WKEKIDMGYTTEFQGRFNINKPLDEETYTFLVKFSETRRMKRTGLGPEFGVDGEFFVGGKGFMGQDHDPSIVDYNEPPKTQPGLWCQWVPTEDRQHIEWNETEKFYNYVEWLEYLVAKILAPRGYSLSGEVTWQGEESSDKGMIIAKDNA